MKSFLLLILSLMITGWEASSDVKGCTDGWVEFTCQHKTSQQYQRVDVVKGSKTIIQSTENNVWQTKGRFSVYYDRENKKLRVVIKQLQRGDFEGYKCKFIFEQKSGNDEVDLIVDGGCQTPFHQTAYRTANTTISCDKRNSEVMFFCKEKGSICEDILSTKSPPKSNGSFTLTETSSSFNMSISNVSSEHAGVYWCGVETDNGSNRAALRKIQLEVKDTITNFTKSPTVGQNLTYWCKYPEGTTIKKFICKGEDPSICKQIVSTAQSNVRKFSMMDDNVKRNITITVRNVTTEDTGTYWCGAERNDPKQSNPFFHRLMMTVVPAKKPPRPTPPTFPVSSTQSTTTTPAPAGRHGEEIITVTVCVSVVVLLLLFVLILILIYKRHSKNKRNAAAAQHKEEYIYEEIQEQPHNPDSGNAMNTMYATANFPTSPSASLHYSTVNFKNRSDKAGAEILLTKPSSSACEYSTVKNSQSQTSSTVNQPSSEDPLYSTVNKSRQQ